MIILLLIVLIRAYLITVKLPAAGTIVAVVAVLVSAAIFTITRLRAEQATNEAVGDKR